MNPAKILVVEDELILAEDMARLLKESGHEVVGIASSGEEAVRLALEKRPDLLLMDIKLKTKMDGIQAASFIRSEFDAPVIFLTAHVDEELFERAKATDPWVYLSKPVSPVELTRNVEMVLLKHQLTRRVKESEERLRSILSSMDDCVLVLDKSGNLVECHRGGSGCGMPSLPQEMVLGRHFTEVLPLNVAELLRDAFTAVRMGGQVQAFDYSVKMDDTEFWFSARVSIVRGPHGEFAGAAIVARDITGRKRAEEDIRDSEERYRSLVDMSPDGIAVYSGGKFVFANRAGAGILGTSPEETIGKSVAEFVHPDFRDAVNERMRQVLEARQSVPLHEAKLVRTDGTVREVEVIEVPIMYGGQPAGQLVVRDVTDRKHIQAALRETQERYRTLAENAPLGLMMIAQQGAFEYVNPKFKELFGYDLRDVPNGREWFRLVFPNTRYRRAIIAGWFDDLQRFKPGEQRPRTYPVKCKDGTEKIISFISVQLENGQHLVTCEDITDRQRAEDALKSSEERYRNVVEMLNEGLVIVDENDCFSYVNPKFASMLEYPTDELIGRSVWEVVDSVHREANALVVAKRQQGVPSSYESVLVGKQGKKIAVIISERPLRDATGLIQGAIGVITDISERKSFEDSLKQARDELEIRVEKRTAELLSANEQLREEVVARIQAEMASRETEERLRAIVETATDSIFIKDPSLNYVFVNPAFSNLVGLPVATILGSSDSDIFGLDAAVHTGELERRVLAGEVVEEEHTRLVQGSPATFLDIRAPMRDELGAIVGVCGISRNITERKQTSSISPLPTEEYPSSAMRSTMTAARLAAQTDSICLITGESGSGKDRLARYIHDRSKRSGGPFYSINCAAIPRELAESELFGYEAGAFTGATRRKRGLIELAEGGTLLLNEISELPLELQSKMLAFLDTMSMTRVGGQKSVSVNVRLIAATNLDLHKEMTERRFRRDLFYRINVFTITVPPLRDRLEDIPLLVDVILSELVSQMGLSEIPRPDSVIMERLRRYPWPGNVRELRNVFERALILSQGRRLLVQDIVLEPGQSAVEHGKPDLHPEARLNQALGSLQRSLIEQALGRCDGNKKKAAEILGISRYALARYMRKLDLSER